VLSFVAQNQTNISADSLRVAVIPPFREVLGPSALYICVLDRLHFDLLVDGVWKEAVGKLEGAAAGVIEILVWTGISTQVNPRQ